MLCTRWLLLCIVIAPAAKACPVQPVITQTNEQCNHDWPVVQALPTYTAGVIRGKLNFLFSHAYGRVGRAATQPLVQREHYDTTDEFSATGPLASMHDFFAVLLPALPPLEVSFEPQVVPPLIVYSDASYHPVPGGGHHSEVAFLIYDPLAPDDTVYAADIVPAEYYSYFHPGLATYINHTESVALAAAVFSAPDTFRGRSFIHFVDNTSALSLFVHGYASRGDCAHLVNIYYLLGASLQFHPYFEWVPSEANIADLPSRSRFDEMLAITPARRIDFVYPPLGRSLVAFARDIGLL